MSHWHIVNKHRTEVCLSCFLESRDQPPKLNAHEVYSKIVVNCHSSNPMCAHLLTLNRSPKKTKNKRKIRVMKTHKLWRHHDWETWIRFQNLNVTLSTSCAIYNPIELNVNVRKRQCSAKILLWHLCKTDFRPGEENKGGRRRGKLWQTGWRGQGRFISREWRWESRRWKRRKLWRRRWEGSFVSRGWRWESRRRKQRTGRRRRWEGSFISRGWRWESRRWKRRRGRRRRWEGSFISRGWTWESRRWKRRKGRTRRWEGSFISRGWRWESRRWKRRRGRRRRWEGSFISRGWRWERKR